MKILFLSTHNLATNPRFFKEIKLAIANGYEVEIICFEFENWSKEINKKLIEELGDVRIIVIPAGRSQLVTWLGSVATEKGYRILSHFISLPYKALSQAVSRRSNLIINVLSKVSRPDWVIGHNPGALGATLFAAKKFNCKAGFDVEDYHPGEGKNLYLQKLTRQLLTYVLPKFNYVSFAAPLIKREIEMDVQPNNVKGFTLLNYFPASEFITPKNNNEGKVKLVWFSQNIDKGRGLELILPLMKNSSGKMELHLYGNLNRSFYEESLKDIQNIIIHSPVSQQSLHLLLADFDIGLALETAKDKNNELAISNKLISYLQAGLYVVATNTKAQTSFFENLQDHGICFEYESNNVAVVMEKIISDIASIRYQKFQRFNNFACRNWETNSSSLLHAWNQ